MGSLALIDGLLRARAAQAAFHRACHLQRRSTARSIRWMAFHQQRRNRCWWAMSNLAREVGY